MDPWTENSMLLGLVTAQRLEDVSAMRRADVVGEYLLVEQQKTGVKLKIPLGLHLEALGMSVGDVLKQCHSRVVHRHLIHHTERYNNVEHGGQVHPQTISKGFKRARERSGVTWPEGKTPPTYHELRSLARRLYAAQGVDVKNLLGHKQQKTSDMYGDTRGDDWIVVEG